jgi:hypothetical protein
MTNLEVLSIANSAVQGTLLTQWTSMTALQSLYSYFLTFFLFSCSFFSFFLLVTSRETRFLEIFPLNGPRGGRSKHCWPLFFFFSSLLIYLFLYFNFYFSDLGSNTLQGSLPSQWSEMTSLETLIVSENLLQGTLPASWSALVNLLEL